MKKISQHWISRIVIGFLACVIGTYVIKEYITQPLLKHLLNSQELSDGIQSLLSGFILLVMYYLIYKFLEKRKLNEIGFSGFGKDMSIGLLTGFGSISLVILFLYSLGYYEVNGINSFSVMLLPLTTIISAALLEEVIFRGIIHRILEERFGTKIALLQALIFGIAHYPNVNSTISMVFMVIIFGVVLGLMYTYTRRIWLPFFFHMSWNFAITVFDTTLSGDTTFNNLLLSKLDGPEFFIGTVFGIEDSFFSFLFITLIAIYLYWICTKKGKLKIRNSIQYKSV